MVRVIEFPTLTLKCIKEASGKTDDAHWIAYHKDGTPFDWIAYADNEMVRQQERGGKDAHKK